MNILQSMLNPPAPSQRKAFRLSLSNRERRHRSYRVNDTSYKGQAAARRRRQMNKQFGDRLAAE